MSIMLQFKGSRCSSKKYVLVQGIAFQFKGWWEGFLFGIKGKGLQKRCSARFFMDISTIWAIEQLFDGNYVYSWASFQSFRESHGVSLKAYVEIEVQQFGNLAMKGDVSARFHYGQSMSSQCFQLFLEFFLFFFILCLTPQVFLFRCSRRRRLV